MSKEPLEQKLLGKTISSGLSEGLAFVHRDSLLLLDHPVPIDKSDVEEEYSFLEEATDIISDDLAVLATRVEKEMDARLAAVFEAHQMMLNDPTLKQELQSEIRNNLVNAGSAVRAVFLRWEKRFLLMESQIARHKGDDMQDLAHRLSNALSGIKVHRLENLPPGSVLVAARLLPSDTIFLSQRSASAVLLEYGGAGSHAALFAREMGLPCLADISNILQRIHTGDYALVDADAGEVILHPSAKSKSAFLKKKDGRHKALSHATKKACQPAISQDGFEIQVLANVAQRSDTERAMANGAEGIGLYRTEQAYLGRPAPPSEDDLYDEMRDVLLPAKGKQICIRLLDIGADKPLPYTGFLAESNPALGRRGIRLLQEYPHLMDTQLRAILRLSSEFDISILVPMATLPADLAPIKELLSKLVSELHIASTPPLGIMIETPAAALSLGSLAEACDFASFGTNDLTQYTFAADRENAAVERYFQDSHAAIFRLMEIARQDAPQLPLSICGELAGRHDHIERILRSGFRAISIAPPLIPTIKETIRHSNCFDSEAKTRSR